MQITFFRVSVLAFLVLIFGSFAPSSANAFTARVCNDGNVEIGLGIAGRNGLGGWYVQGWHVLRPRRCFSRGSVWEREFYFTYQYQDAQGKWGFGDFRGTEGLFHRFKVSRQAFCVDVDDAFNLTGSFRKLSRCTSGQVLERFPIHVEGGKGETYKLSLRPDMNVLHQGAVVGPDTGADKGVDGLEEAVLACKGGDAEGCKTAYEAFLWGSGSPSALERQQAAEMAGMGCELKDVHLCYDAAALFSEKPDAISKQKARKYFAMACDLGHKVGCYFAGKAYINGDGGEMDGPTGAEFLRRSCNPASGRRPYETACIMLVKVLEDPTSLPFDMDRAAAVRQTLCEDLKSVKFCASK